MSRWHLHPAVRTGGELTMGERVADSCVRAMGSWKFIIVQAIVMASWMILNVAAICYHWDPYPFILLNLALSTQAAFAAPLILLAGRRQDQRNSEVATADLQSDQRSETILRAIAAHLGVPTEEIPSEDPVEDPAVGPTGGPGGVPARRTLVAGGDIQGPNPTDSDSIIAHLNPATHFDMSHDAKVVLAEIQQYRIRRRDQWVSSCP